MPTIPSTAMDTAAVARHQRFALWHAALAPTHEADLPEGSNPAEFNASASGWNLGRVLVLATRSSPQLLRRTKRSIRTDQIDHYIVRLQRGGRWTGEFGGDRVATANPGSVMVLDMARPSRAETTEIDNVNVLLPRDALDDVVPPSDLHGFVFGGAAVILLRNHLDSLAVNLQQMRVHDAVGVADATARIVAACLAPSRDNIERSRAPLSAARLDEIRRYIDGHLRDPGLSSQSICRALGISRSTLYNACEPMGGVAGFIRQRRLRRIHALLADPEESRLISQIAYLFGFANNSHFSRSFRSTFGYSPREAREAAASGEAHHARTPDGGASYENWVRRIGA